MEDIPNSIFFPFILHTNISTKDKIDVKLEMEARTRVTSRKEPKKRIENFGRKQEENIPRITAFFSYEKKVSISPLHC